MNKVQNRNETALVAPQVLFHTYWELRDRGCDLSNEPRWKDLHPSGLAKTGWRPSFQTSKAMIKHALQLSGDSDLGLAIGQRQSFGSLGLIGAAILASQTVGNALQLAIKYHTLTGSMLEFELEPAADGNIRVHMKSRFPDTAIRRFLVQEAMMFFISIARYILPKQNPVLEIATTYRPINLPAFRDHCGCEIDLESETNSLLVAGDVLFIKMDTADGYALNQVTMVMDELLSQELAERDILQNVESMILGMLPKVPTLPEVAADIGKSERSIRRQLAAAGTSFRTLLEDVRLDRAQQLIADGNLSRSEIAHQIGFEDARSLRRLLASAKKSTG